jgi:signal transduction histidine kinase
MNSDPKTLRSRRFVQVGRIIQRDAARIVERWSEQAVSEQPHALRAHHQVLRDHLPSFLQALGHSLADSTNPVAFPHRGPAIAHGEQRWEAGWSLTEVVRDYQILRLVLLDHLKEQLKRTPRFHEVQAIGLALDDAIAASVHAYVRFRDEHLARLEQERAKQQQMAEEALRSQTAALQEADRRKNEFLAMLGHELRNPLAPILHSLEVLRLLGPDDPTPRQAHDVIERQVRQLVRLVDDLLDVTRIAQGKLRLRRSHVNLAAVVDQAVQTTAPFYLSRNHVLSVSLPTEPLSLEADEGRLVQVVVNLLNNAGKYTEPGGQIFLTVTREDGEAVLRVRDNGAGIGPENLGRIFDLFQQGSRSEGGLGVGLTLVRQLVELHGGRVTAHSEGSGKGSEFVVHLPLAQETQTKTDSAI